MYKRQEWVFAYDDHAYVNQTSNDPNEIPGLGWLNPKLWLSNAIHFMSDKKHGRNSNSPNTGAMANYPSNIRGDSYRGFETAVSEMPIEFQNWFQSQMNENNYISLRGRKSLSEAAKLGHFEPEVLDVDIKKLRKNIMPEFPKKAPPKMIDGYSERSQLAPKKAEREPFIKITKKDLARNHKLKDSEIKEFMDTFKMINDFVKKHPEELIYAQQRYPMSDKRLAALNWKMDQMLNAGQEYLDTQFPENQRLVDRIKKATKKTMELTNPEAYKGLKKPDMKLMSLDDHMKEKRVVSRHFKKKRQSKSMFRVDMEKVKEKNRKVAEQKVAEWQEKRRIELLNSNEFENQKSDWRKEFGENFVNTTQGMKVGQTFSHVPSGQTVTTGGVLGGIETIQTSVSIFGDEIPGPNASQYGLQGFAKPIDIMRRGKKKTEELNKELDSSEDYTKEIKADKFMKGRVEDSVDSALLSDLGYKSTEDILAEVGDLWTYEEYMAMLDAIADKAAAKSLPITNKILEYSPTGKTPGDVPISLIDAQEAITNARNKAEQALHLAWERYNKVPDLPDGGEEPIAKSRRSNYTPQEIAQNRENLKNSIITTATGVIDGARNLNRVNYALNLAKRQSAKSGGSTRINTIPANSLGGRNNPVETKMHFQSKKAFIKSIDLNNTDKDIASQIVDNSADAAQYALGFKAVHSQIPYEDGSQENNVKLNSKGDLEMFDNYAFRPDGYMDTGIAKAAKFFGGTELQKDAATLIDKAGPIGWLSHALLGDIPDRQDPAVRIKTTITKKELIKILGAADYKIFVNRMNKERKKRKVNESNTFSKIKRFTNKY